MQRTIYIKDDGWDQIREWAGKDGRTVSGYLVNAHLDFIGRELLEEVCKVIPSPKSLDEVFNEAVDELAKEKKDSTFSPYFKVRQVKGGN